MSRARAFLVVLVVLLAAAAPAQQQEEVLRVRGPEPATVVLTERAEVQIRIENPKGQPRAFQVPDVPGLGTAVFGPRSETNMSIVNGRRSTQTALVWTLVLEPRREGTFTVPAFPIWTGSRNQQVPSLEVTAVKELRGAEFGYLDVRVEPRRVYVHEPVRVRVEFGVDAGLQIAQGRADRYRYFDCEVQAQWLTDMEGAEPIELEQPEGTPVVLNRHLQFTDYAPQQERGGRTWRSFVFHKAFLPVRPGPMELAAPILRYNVLVGRQRIGLFGEPLGQGSENYYVYGEPVRLEVLPIPEEGRPRPYYGAVGRFTIEAAVDRDVVQVGSSVKLTLAIRGQGNLEFLRVPDLSGLEAEGLHLLGQTEERRPDQVLVTYDLTPLRADVDAVPAIGWNFFDTTPGVERFESVATEPIPLEVRPLADGETLAPLPDEERKPVTPGVDDIFDLPELGGDPVPTPGLWRGSAWLAALGPWVLCALALLAVAFRRRRAADPLGVRARAAGRTCERALQRGDDPAAALAAYLGARLGLPDAAVIGPDLRQRLGEAGLEPAMADEVAAAVERGVAARYGGGGGLDAEVVRGLVRRLEGARLRRLPAAVAMLAVALLLAARLPAQADEGLEAYRRGDYAAAEAAFARALERTDDRRLWFARGNCFYRLGDLPRARWAYECARLGLPRDEELLANLELVRRELELDGGGESFTAAAAALRDRFTAPELAWSCALLMAVAAVLLGPLRRRAAARWVGAIVLVPGVLVAVELLWLRPQRPPAAIALRRLELVAEPRAGLPATAHVEPGVRLVWRSGAATGGFVRVDAGGRSGYAPREDVARIE